MLNVNQIPDSIGFYFAGFVDGEGSFHLTFRRRHDYKLPWKVSLSLNVSQKDKVILALFKRHIGCGLLREKGGGVWMWEVSNLTAIRENVIPFFRRFRFLSAKKKRDFAVFEKMAAEMAGDAHLSQEGIVLLLKLRENMNDGGKRKFTDAMILEAFERRESSETVRQTLMSSFDHTDVDKRDDTVRSSVRAEEVGRNDPPTDVDNGSQGHESGQR